MVNIATCKEKPMSTSTYNAADAPTLRGKIQGNQITWPTEEELFGRWWSLGPGDARDQEFWTPRKVAERAQYAESRIRGLCDEGKLPFFKVGGRILIHIPSLLSVGRIGTPNAA